MSDGALEQLAVSAGLLVDWTDASGQARRVAPDTLRAVLGKLGVAAGSDPEVRDSTARFVEERRQPAALLTLDSGQPLLLPEACEAGPGEIRLESGETRPVTLERVDGGCRLAAIEEVGFHTLAVGQREIALAVAPTRAFAARDAAPGRRLLAVAAQIYALREAPGRGYGDFADLAAFAEKAGRRGADAIAISPTHALYADDPGRFSPYSPSTRLFLNGCYADPATAVGAHEPLPPLPDPPLIQWEQAVPSRLAWLRRVFDGFRSSGDPVRAQAFAAFREDGGERLERHARFETLHAHFRAQEIYDWRRWPAPFRQAGSRDVRAFADERREQVDFHLFLQWLAATGLAAAQERATAAGMAIGLIADLAVGIDPAGSQAWSTPDDLLAGLSVGAPPDLLGPLGQDWGVTSFSPTVLRSNGFGPFRETLQAAMRHGGGVRIDHAMGLQRLWVIPEGATPMDGAYLRYPLDDMLRLIALESQRHRAIVVAEDLGTVPEGFRDRLAARAMLGMRVLFFEREGEGFTVPARYEAEAAALTTTHDLATVAGWWKGREIDWRERIGLARGKEVDDQRWRRGEERTWLWQAFREAGVAAGPEPAPEDPEAVVDAAVRFVAATPSRLAIVPVEDLAGLDEQPNLPGTTDQHPNWRRRLPEQLLSLPGTERRLIAALAARADGEADAPSPSTDGPTPPT